MDGSHIDFPLKELHDEQRSIDGIIESLLNYVPSSLTTGYSQRKGSDGNLSNSSTSSSTPTNLKKGRGRPPKVNPPSPLPTVSSQKLSLDVIAECLKKLNEQNKRLLNFVEVLSNDVKKDSAENPTQQSDEVSQKATVESVNNRLEKLEQNVNSNILICRGPAIESLITESVGGGSHPNLERLKGDVCRAVCGDDVTGVDVCNLQLSPFGRDRKSIKVSCSNSASKLHLLKQARRTRPQGIYLSEFLTTNKLRIFYNLRQLKKQHPGTIKSVFTKGGNLFYRLQNSNQAVQVNSLNDLSNITAPTVANSESGN